MRPPVSYAPYPNQPPPGPYGPDVGPPEEPNNAAVVGFILSVTGLLVCGGLLCPFGLVVSAMGLKKRNNQGLAIAGLVLGIAGTIALVIFVIYIVVAFAAFAAFFAALFGVAASAVNENAQTFTEIGKAQREIEKSVQDSEEKELPSNEEGTRIVKRFKDFWGHPLRYERDPGQRHRYTIRSAGADGKFDTSDDIKKSYNSVAAHATPNPRPAPSGTDVLTPWPPKL